MDLRKKVKIGWIGALWVFIGILAACSASTTTSGFGTGAGYSIEVSAAITNVPQGGSAVLLARVRDNSGSPAPDGTSVFFTADKGTITDFTGTATGTATTTGGVAQLRYNAGSTAASLGVVNITGTSQGATARISLFVF
jgi:hypothetical protein